MRGFKFYPQYYYLTRYTDTVQQSVVQLFKLLVIIAFMKYACDNHFKKYLNTIRCGVEIIFGRLEKIILKR